MIMPDMVLPDTVFFNPKRTFMLWLDKQPPPVIDAGAGVGLLGELYPGKVMCFDIIPRQNPRCTVYPIDTTVFPFTGDCTVIMARPSAGSWIHETWRQALERGARVFYAGLAKNYERDLTAVEYVPVLSGAGSDGEELFEIMSFKTKTGEDNE